MSQSFDENTGRDSQTWLYPIDFVSCTGKPGEDLPVVRPSLELFISEYDCLDRLVAWNLATPREKSNDATLQA